MNGLFITGTDTDVGKTFITCLLATGLQQHGMAISARKPIASGCTPHCTDAMHLGQATGEDDQLVCPYRFPLAVSPERAMRYAGKTITIGDCVDACNNSRHFTLVEGAGGWLSPLTSDGNNADLAQSLNLPVVLVVANRLGCINHTLLTLEAIEQRGLSCTAIILNALTQHIDQDNLHDLKQRIIQPIFPIDYQAQHAPPALIEQLINLH